MDTGLYLLAPLALFALRARWRSQRDIAYALPLLCIFVHMFGVMRVGGDHFEYRPLDFYWPALSVPVSAAILDLGSRISSARLLRQIVLPVSVSAANMWSLIIFAAMLFYCSAIQGMLLLKGARGPGYAGQPHVELNDRNAEWFLNIPGMSVLVPISNDLRRLAVKQTIAVSFAQHRAFANERIQTWSTYGNMERGLIPAGVLTDDGGRGLGIPYYYLPDLKTIDTWGLTDATVARTPVLKPNSLRNMAHDRQPPRGYLVERGVNIRVYPPANSKKRALSTAPFALRVGVDLWMPFDGIYGFNQSIIDEFANHALSTEGYMNFEDIIASLGSPLIQSEYDVYIAGNYIVYRKENCIAGYSGSRRFRGSPADADYSPPNFFLYVVPVDPGDLPVYHRQFGFHRFEFNFAEYGRKINGSCVVARRLPGYAIASIRTGQFVSATGYGVWEGKLNFLEEDGVDDMDIEHFLEISDPPAIRADYDVYIVDNHVVYKRTQCEAEDVNLPFFLHVFPIDRDDLPVHRQPHGFDNLDFGFAEFGRYIEGICIATRELPDYPVSSIATGQFKKFTFDQFRTWGASFDVVGQTGGDVAP